MPIWLFILIASVVYMIGGWITTGIFGSTEQGRKFSDDEMFGLFILWPLVALKGVMYAIGKSGRGASSAVFKLFRYW
jgi:hypothetical protein